MRAVLECFDPQAAASWAHRLAGAGVELCPATQLRADAKAIDALILVVPPVSGQDLTALLHSVRTWNARLPERTPIVVASSGFPRGAEEMLEAGVAAFLSDIMETEEIRIRLRAACRSELSSAESLCVRARTALALSLAHDYNNILSAIQGNVDLSLMNPSMSQDVRYNLEQVGKSVARAANLTKSLIEWLRPEPAGSSTLDLADTLRRLAPLIQEMAGNRELEFDLARDTQMIELSLYDLLSLLADSFKRADAEGWSGKVRISLAMEGEARACLLVGGPGAPGKAALRKELRVVKPEPVSPAGGEAPVGGGTILLVDDEDAIRNAAQRILRREGYTVLEASSGEEGLELFKTIGGMIDAVILDLHMPGMEGGEVLHHMRDLRPEVKVVVWSGFPEEVARRQMNGFADVTFLEKPAQLAEFPVMLARALKSQQE